MVIAGRRGNSTLGCLLWVLGMAVVLYYGSHIAQRYFDYYQLQEEMRSQARLAPGLTDPVIRRRIADRIDQLGLNIDPRKVKITRGGRPRRIIIETEYADTVVLPAFKRVFIFRPRADEPL